MSWIRLVDGRPTYSGHLTPPRSFEAWCRGEGKPLVDAITARRRFTLFGKARAARNELWATLRAQAERGPLADAIRVAVDAYLPLIAEIATLPVDLPRRVVSLRRVVVVPRVLCNASALDYVEMAVAHADLSAVDEGERLRQFFSMELLAAIDDSVLTTAATNARGVRASREWMIIDADRQFSWWVPLFNEASREWRGHYVLYEAPPEKLARATRKELVRETHALAEQLPALTRHQRNEVVTQARSRMRELTARAARAAAV